MQNIVLIRDPEDSRKFYPRFNLEDTSSFNDLDEHRCKFMYLVSLIDALQHIEILVIISWFILVFIKIILDTCRFLNMA